MKIKNLSIKNYRSFIDSGEFEVSSNFALVGENNSGKSSVLNALSCLCTSGAGGVKVEDFNDPESVILIKATFTGLSEAEKLEWRPYLVAGDLILEKELKIVIDARTRKEKVDTEYHGYKAEPKDWHLSFPKIEERIGSRPKWADIVQELSLPDYFMNSGKCTKKDYKEGVQRFLLENQVEYDEPDISETQALGLQSNVVANLPQVFVLPAITDYSDEIDKRNSKSTFRRLSATLAERLIKLDPNYQKIERAINSITQLLNTVESNEEEETEDRLPVISTVEGKISEFLKQMMPSIVNVSMNVEIDEIKDIFSNGLSLTIDDGAKTDVLAKGHGLQRCLVFSLLKSLILSERNELTEEQVASAQDSIILAIEEPELYLHPQVSKLFFDVMSEFSDTDQVIYTTHSPQFVDASKFEDIAIVKKQNDSKVIVCRADAFDGLTDHKIFQGLTRLNPAVNELLFAKKVLLTEGPEDVIAITYTLQHIGMIKTRTEEIELTLIPCGGKESIPFFQRVLNGFSIPYAVLHDTDLKDDMREDARATQEKRNKAIADLAGENKVHCFPIKLESTLGLTKHLKDQYETHAFFSESSNINDELIGIVSNAIDV